MLIDISTGAKLVDEYVKRIREDHGENCPWRNKGCDGMLSFLQSLRSIANCSLATIQHLPLANTDTAIAGLHDRYRNIVKMGDKLPVESAIQTPDSFDLDGLIKTLPEDWFQDSDQAPQATVAQVEPNGDSIEPASQPPAEPSKSVNRAALSIALFGWDTVTDGAAGLVGCKACFRRLGLWMYKPKENGDVTVYTSLDVMSEHMEYCPWIDRLAQSGTGKPNEKIDNLRSGWEIVAEACKVKHRRRLRSVASMDAAHSRPSTPLEETIPDEENEESRKSADREWWAKIRRIRHALTPKSPHRKSTPSK